VLTSGVPHHLAWRLILAFGVLPSLLVLYQRRHMPESRRWTAEHGDEQQAMKDFEKFSRAGTQTFSAPETTSEQSRQTRRDKRSTTSAKT
jgi:Sugar (and other) transporter